MVDYWKTATACCRKLSFLTIALLAPSYRYMWSELISLLFTSLMTKTDTVLKALCHLLFIPLTWLLDRESFTEFSRH